MKVKLPKVNGPVVGKSLAAGGVVGAILGAGYLARPDNTEVKGDMELLTGALHLMETKLENLEETVEKNREEVKGTIKDAKSEMNRSIGVNSKLTDWILGEMKVKIEGMEDRLGDEPLDGGLGSLREEFKAHEGQVTKNTAQLGGIQGSIKSLEEKLKSLLNMKEDLEAKIKEEVAGLKTNLLQHFEEMKTMFETVKKLYTELMGHKEIHDAGGIGSWSKKEMKRQLDIITSLTRRIEKLEARG